MGNYRGTHVDNNNIRALLVIELVFSEIVQ